MLKGNKASQRDVNDKDSDFLETDNSQDEAISTDTHPLPSPLLESINSTRDGEDIMDIAFLCNPNDEDENLRGHHQSELSSNELDDVEKRSFPEELDCE